MARSPTPLLLLAALLLSASLASAQRATGSGANVTAAAPVPPAKGTSPGVSTATGPSLSTTNTNRGQVFNNRTVGTQLIIPPQGCMVVTVTAQDGLCLQDAAFQVNFNNISTPADYAAAGIAGSNGTRGFFDLAGYQANNTACSNSRGGVTQLYETDGCVLEAAVANSSAAGSVSNSFVCESGRSTSSYAQVYTQDICEGLQTGISRSISAGNGAAASGDPCTAARATYLIQNPCPAENTTVNTTARFFLAPDTDLVPAPAPEELLVPEPSPVEAPGPDVPEDAPADSPEAPSDAPAVSADALAPAPGDSAAADDQAAGRGAIYNIAAAAVAAAAAWAMLA